MEIYDRKQFLEFLETVTEDKEKQKTVERLLTKSENEMGLEGADLRKLRGILGKKMGDVEAAWVMSRYIWSPVDRVYLERHNEFAMKKMKEREVLVWEKGICPICGENSIGKTIYGRLCSVILCQAFFGKPPHEKEKPRGFRFIFE